MGFEVLGIAAQAIQAQQLALDVTGNNMANATTPGYHTESVNLTENASAPNAVMPITLIGNGVTATAVTRATNAFLSSSVRNQTSAVGYATALSQGVSQVQNIFQEPQSGGLAEMMNQFNQSWLTLSQTPQSLSAREGVIQDGQTLASTLNGMASSLSNEEASVNQNITSNVQQINQYAGQIAHLNQQIATVSTSGQKPNDLMDQRGQLLTELSQLVNVSYANGPANSLDVYIGAHPLVTGEQTYGMTTNPEAVPGSKTSSTTSGAAGSSNFTADVPQWVDTGAPVQALSGSLAGNMALIFHQTLSGSTTRSFGPGYLTGYGNQLSVIAQSLATTVNGAQASGYDLTGTKTGASAVPFFTGTTAGTITVNTQLTASDLAAASQASSPGDGSNAENLYNGLTAGGMVLNATTNTYSLVTGAPSQAPTVGGYYQSLVGQVGLDGQNANNLQTGGQSTLTSLNNDLQSATGVDLNQQSVNMIQEQQSYEAAAKLVTAQQSMTQSLLSAVG